MCSLRFWSFVVLLVFLCCSREMKGQARRSCEESRYSSMLARAATDIFVVFLCLGSVCTKADCPDINSFTEQSRTRRGYRRRGDRCRSCWQGSEQQRQSRRWRSQKRRMSRQSGKQSRRCCQRWSWRSRRPQSRQRKRWKRRSGKRWRKSWCWKSSRVRSGYRTR